MENIFFKQVHGSNFHVLALTTHFHWERSSWLVGEVTKRTTVSLHVHGGKGSHWENCFCNNISSWTYFLNKVLTMIVTDIGLHKDHDDDHGDIMIIYPYCGRRSCCINRSATFPDMQWTPCFLGSLGTVSSFIPCLECSGCHVKRRAILHLQWTGLVTLSLYGLAQPPLTVFSRSYTGCICCVTGWEKRLPSFSVDWSHKILDECMVHFTCTYLLPEEGHKF